MPQHWQFIPLPVSWILDPFGAFFGIALGACFGNTVAYAIGYYLGNKIYDGSIKWIDQQQMTKTQAFFAKHGKLTEN